MVKLVGIVTSFNEARIAKSYGADLVEIRLDLLEKISLEKASRLFKDIKEHLKLPIILTIRKKSEGGSFKGTDASRLKFFSVFTPLSDYIDIEISSVKSLKGIIYLSKTKKKKLILSYHNFINTPSFSQIDSIIKQASASKPFITKIACFCNTTADFIRLLDLCKNQAKSSNLAIIPMGKFSQIGRILCPMLGSSLAYGYIDASVVSNQLSLKQLKLMLK